MIRLGRISYVNMAPVFYRLDAEVDEVQGVPCVLDRRDRCQIELAGEQPRVQLGRHPLHLVHLGIEPVEDRRHVHVGDAAEAEH